MSVYANKNSKELVEKALNDNKLYVRFLEIVHEFFNDDDEKYKSVLYLINKYNEKEELREGIDLAFIALTGYSLGTLIQKSIDIE